MRAAKEKLIDLEIASGGVTEHSKWVQLKRILEYEIAYGKYPRGSQLPTTRELTARFGINKNTASKAYSALRRDGLVEIVKGKGVFVSRFPESDGIENFTALLSKRISQILREAVQMGVSMDSIRDTLHHAAKDIEQSIQNRVAFAECNEQDAQYYAQHLASRLAIPVRSFVLSDQVESDIGLLDKFDIVTTPLFHLRDVMARLGERASSVVGILLIPEIEMLLRLASLDGESIIGFVDSGLRPGSLESIADLIRSYTAAAVKSCAISEVKCLREIFNCAELIIDTIPCHEQLLTLSPPTAVLTIKFVIDDQSIDYLRHRLSAFQ